jgi:hypothetical protein
VSYSSTKGGASTLTKVVSLKDMLSYEEKQFVQRLSSLYKTPEVAHIGKHLDFSFRLHRLDVKLNMNIEPQKAAR